jgi:hypothetical protein
MFVDIQDEKILKHFQGLRIRKINFYSLILVTPSWINPGSATAHSIGHP